MFDRNLIVTDLLSVYHVTTESWKRPVILERPSNGIVFFTHGSIAYDSPIGSFTAGADDLLFLPKGFCYSGKKLTESQSFYVIDFETAGDRFTREFRPVTHPRHPQRVLSEFEKMVSLWNGGTDAGKLVCLSGLYALLGEIFTDPQTAAAEQSPIMKSVLDYINSHLSDVTLSFSGLCEKFRISSSQLRRDFHRSTGRSPVQYITEKRIELACLYLTEGNITVGEIAGLCGFGSDYYFSRVFRSHRNCTPSEYLRRSLSR